MPINIVIRQRISSGMDERAGELRRNMTPTEKILWDQLRTNKLKGLHFRRRQVIDGHVVDFYCHACALIVEIDGDIHDRQIPHDQAGDASLVSRGFTAIRFRNNEVVDNLPVVLQKILDNFRTSQFPFPIREEDKGVRLGEAR
jgi:very-short-patch-repair endonuclease